MEAHREIAEVDIQTFGDQEETFQGQVAFASFDGADEREMEADPFAELHLTETEFVTAGADAVAEFGLRRDGLTRLPHPLQSMGA